MTKRRLINIKAYNELLLLKKLAKSDENNKYTVSIQVNDNDKEEFVIEHYEDDEWISTIVGENYTVVSKMLIDYLSKL